MTIIRERKPPNKISVSVPCIFGGVGKKINNADENLDKRKVTFIKYCIKV